MKQDIGTGGVLIDPAILQDRLAAVAREPALDAAGRQAAALDLLKQADRDGLDEAAARLADGAPGLGVAQSICALRDAVIGAAFDFVIDCLHPRARGKLALAAVGGYGRGTLAHHSDIDLLFLVPPKAPGAVLRAVEAVLYLLWDMGLKVGHATRTVDEGIELARADMTIRTTLLEMRCIAGELTLYTELSSRYWEEVAEGTGAEFVAAKLDERDLRHVRTGQSRYLVEPNVKDGKGGFRDLHTLYWIAKYVYRAENASALVDLDVLSPQEFRTFQRAEAFLWDVRCHLHAYTGRAEDRLTFDLQPEIARRLGYADRGAVKGVEAFMKNYFLVARDVGVLTRIIAAALELERRKSVPGRWRVFGPSEATFGSTPGFVVHHGRLSIEHDRVLSDDPVNVLRLVWLADREGLYINPNAYRLAIEASARIGDDVRNDPEANRLFLEVLTSRNDPERSLRRLNEMGALGLFIPEFAGVVGRMQFNMYHHYTVDEHLIRAVGHLSRFEKGALRTSFPVADTIARGLRARKPLYLAALFHDAAKGRPGDHWIVGEQIMRELGPRLGLTAAETGLAAWLIRHHMIMSDTAQRRDIYDERTSRQFAEIVQTPARLRLLLLLTVTDMHAVGPGIWTDWKRQLLQNLYEETLPLLGGEHAAPARAARVAKVKDRVAARLGGWAAAERDPVMQRFGDAYWFSLDEDTLVRNAALVRAADAEIVSGGLPVLTEVRQPEDRPLMQVTVVTRDRRGLFADLTGALAGTGAAIMDAKVFTAPDGLVLDVFWVSGLDAAVDGARLKARLLAAVREGKAFTPARPPPMMGRRLKAFTVPPEVSVDNEASAVFTVIEVAGRDRPGLLHDLSAALRDLKLSIGSAHVATYGERAVDVFYVKGPAGLKVTGEARIAEIEQRLEEVLEG
ncbi:MAG: [protein-PII] uridylyltransferase [Alphaproteobacteria bacterium]